MKKLLYIFILCGFCAVSVRGQNTESQNQTVINVVRNNTLTPARVANALDVLNSSKMGFMSEYTASGTDIYTLTANPAIVSYQNGLTLNVKFPNANTSGTVTLNVNSIGASPVKNNAGADVDIGEISAGGSYLIRHNGTEWRITGLPAGGGGVPQCPAPGQTFAVNHTFELADVCNNVGIARAESASPLVFTIPTNADEPFAVWTQIGIINRGPGSLTIDDAVGVTINLPPGVTQAVLDTAQFAVAVKVDTDEWDVSVSAEGGASPINFASNGLSFDADSVILGGDVTRNTTITNDTSVFNIGSIDGPHLRVDAEGSNFGVKYIGLMSNGNGIDAGGNSSVVVYKVPGTGSIVRIKSNNDSNLGLFFTMQSDVNESVLGSNIANFQGIKYNADYSSDYVNRSLVDKEYVDNAVTGGGGITNGAANNEIPKSNGTNLVASGMFSTAAGNVTWGSGSLAGDRTETISSSTSNANKLLVLQGVAGYEDISTTGATGSVRITPASGLINVGQGLSRGTIAGSDGGSSGGNMMIDGGDGSSSDGNIGVFTRSTTINWQNAQKAAYVHNATSIPTLGEADGTFLYSFDVGGSSELFVKNEAGVETQLSGELSGSATLNFDLTALNFQDLTITVTGAAAGDIVSIGVPAGAVVNDVTYFGWVSATNTVSVRASRVGGGGAADPASGTFKARVIK